MSATTPILTRKATPWPERQTAHVSESKWRAGNLAAMLDAAAVMRVRTLSLVAGPYADQRPNRDWMLAPSHAGWDISNYLGDPPRATYRQDGCAVDVVTTAPWFGECLDKPAIEDAWRRLKGLLRGQFDPGATLMSTPAGTGLDLLRRSLPCRYLPDGMVDPTYGVYPVAPADIRQLLHDNIGQGRFDFLPTTADTSDLFWIDRRWSYAACVSNLPRGEMRYEASHEYIEQTPAFYFCRWKAPADWPFPFGLLPELTGEESPRFHYPLDRQWHTGLIAGVELEMARAEGWDVRISERLWWDNSVARQPDPAREWAGNLRIIREKTRDKLVSDATRHILIDAVGAWGRQARRELHITPAAVAETTIPADEVYGLKAIDGVYEWFRNGELPKALLDMQHPEWNATVWRRSVVQTVKAGMRYLRTCPGGEITNWRSDAFVVTLDPGWVDDNKVGTFRRKRHLEAVAVPHDETAYRALIAEEEE